MSYHQPTANGSGTNALGVFIERTFTDPFRPVKSYTDLERHSGVSREALSRYVTARADRHRSPTLATLVPVAVALHVSIEALAHAAAYAELGLSLPDPEPVEALCERGLAADLLLAQLTDGQYSAVLELLHAMQPPRPAGE